MAFDGGFDDGAHLHLENFGISDRQSAATMAQHGVGFVQLLDATGDDLDIDLQIARKLFLFGALVRNKFVEGRVNQPDRDRKAVHGFEDANEIAALERQ